jgi:YVTN family beta-propeller protein
VRLFTLLLLVKVATIAQPITPEPPISLGNITGRIDHMAADAATHRIYLAALGNNTVEVIDTEARKVIRSISGLKHPQGVLFWPDVNRFAVANADDGRVIVYDAESYTTLLTFELNGGDADNIRMDRLKEIIVGYGDGALAWINTSLAVQVGNTMLDAHPESFQLEKNGPRLFVNVPEAPSGPHVTVIDRRTRSVTAKWPLPGGVSQNYPMALDEAGHRLFIGCRKPAEMLAFDTQSGKVIATAPIPGDTDDLFYDATSKRVYVSGGEGAVAVIDNDYKTVASIATAKGARTSLFVPGLKRLFVAVPNRGKKQRPELLVYRVSP